MLFVFDAYGTLLDVNAAVSRHRDAIGPEADRLSELWRAKQLEYTWTRTLLGRYVDFWTLTEAALDVAMARCGGCPGCDREALLRAYRQLDPYPDARSSLSALRAAGHRTAILSNATAAMLADATQAARLDPHLDACLSVDPLGLYKPDPRAYRLVGEHFGTAPDAVTFVSANRWDVAGGAAFGFNTVWLNRTGAPDEYRDLAPGRTVTSLADLASLLPTSPAR